MTTPANGGGAQAATTGTPQGGQEPTGQQGQQTPEQGQQAGQEPGSGTQGQGGQQQGQTGQPDLSQIADPNLRAWVEAQARQAAEARQEAARYRTERNTFQAKVTEYERANETAEQAAERERQEAAAETERLRQENADLKVGGAVRSAAEAAKAFDPALVDSMVRAQVVLDAEGKPTNVPALIDALKAERPYLFRRTDAGAGAGGGEGGSPSPGNLVNDLIRGGTGRLAR